MQYVVYNQDVFSASWIRAYNLQNDGLEEVFLFVTVITSQLEF